MDVLKPELMWIGGRCYRVNKTTESNVDNVIPNSNQYIEDGKPLHSKRTHQTPNQFYDNMFSDHPDLYAEDDDDDYDIQQIERNRFKTTFHVPQ